MDNRIGAFNVPIPDPPSEAEVAQARMDQMKSSLIGFGVAGAVGGTNYRANAPGGAGVQKFISGVFTGVGMKPGAAGRAVPHFGPLTGLSGALPGPVGYVPPEVYDLPPDVYARIFGVPRSELLGTTGSAERLKVYAAREYATKLDAELRFELGATAVRPFRSPFTAERPFTPTVADIQFIKSLPSGFSPVQELLPKLEARFPGSFGTQHATLPAATVDTVLRQILSQDTSDEFKVQEYNRYAKLYGRAPITGETIRRKTPPDPFPEPDPLKQNRTVNPLDALASRLTQGVALRIVAAKLSTDP